MPGGRLPYPLDGSEAYRDSLLASRARIFHYTGSPKIVCIALLFFYIKLSKNFKFVSTSFWKTCVFEGKPRVLERQKRPFRVGGVRALKKNEHLAWDGWDGIPRRRGESNIIFGNMSHPFADDFEINFITFNIFSYIQFTIKLSYKIIN